MNDKTKVWKSSTTTRSWSSVDGLTPEQQAEIEALLDGKMGGTTVTEKWSYAGFENGEAFKVDIDNGAVTVNGRRYDSLDEVPRAERERIEALRSGQGMEGLWGMLRNAGVDVGDLGAGLAAARGGKPAFTIETEGDGPASPNTASPTATRTATPTASATPPATQRSRADASSDPALSPGAVPTGGGLRRTLLIGIAIGLALWVAQALNLF